MNHYTEVLRYIKQLAEQDPLVNTVTQGVWDDLDIDNANLFPLVHIYVSGAAFTNGQTVILNVQIGAFAVRDKVNEVVTDKFWRQDNEVDNFNETLAILNRIWTKMYTDFEERDITATENPNAESHSETRGNLLDGWVLTFDVELPNTTLNLCQYENP